MLDFAKTMSNTDKNQREIDHPEPTPISPNRTTRKRINTSTNLMVDKNQDQDQKDKSASQLSHIEKVSSTNKNLIRKDTLDQLASRLLSGDIGARISQRMYDVLFAKHPELRFFFCPDSFDDGSQNTISPQAQLMAKQLFVCFTNIHNEDLLSSCIDRIAMKHVSRGVKPEMYQAVIEALAIAVKEENLTELDDETIATWFKVVQQLSDALIQQENAIAREAMEKPGGWSGFRPFIPSILSEDKVNGMSTMTILIEPLDGCPLPSFAPGQWICLKIHINGQWFYKNFNFSLYKAPRHSNMDSIQSHPSSLTSSPDSTPINCPPSIPTQATKWMIVLREDSPTSKFYAQFFKTYNPSSDSLSTSSNHHILPSATSQDTCHTDPSLLYVSVPLGGFLLRPSNAVPSVIPMKMSSRSIQIKGSATPSPLGTPLSLTPQQSFLVPQQAQLTPQLSQIAAAMFQRENSGVTSSRENSKRRSSRQNSFNSSSIRPTATVPGITATTVHPPQMAVITNTAYNSTPGTTHAAVIGNSTFHSQYISGNFANQQITSSPLVRNFKNLQIEKNKELKS